ncbi:MAG: hypothetical protein FJ387_19115 [Verrucomicrobia bacterium]|nr:hypothetical protein [Verrucomicrobiota bacterium]
MRSAKTPFVATILVAAVLVGLLVWQAADRPRPKAKEPLIVYCAAGLKPPMEVVARDYEQAYGTTVQLQYGGSGTLLSNLRIARRGDLFLAADSTYLELARSNHLVAEVIPLARMKPVIAVRRGNPKQVRLTSDLLRADVAVALANPDAAAIGKVARESFERSGHWAELIERAKVLKPTVNDVANDLKLGTVDAGILWDAVVRQYPELEAVAVPELASAGQEVSLGVLRFSAQPTAALHFARYVGARDRGQLAFARAGYEPVAGDAWAERPEVLLYSGGVNRLAIEETIQQFEQREGAQVTRVYNGCGILVAQMKLGQQPDAYLACDVSYLTPVQNLFNPGIEVSETDIVLLVAKGNPLGLRALADLARPGLRVGMANPRQSTLGDLTVQLLERSGVADGVLANVRSQTPTADLLVNQIRTGSLDVVVVYEANTSQVRDFLDVVHLGVPGAVAVQPYAVGTHSAHPQLMSRLRAAIQKEASRQRYAALGFRCRGEAAGP